MDGFLSRTGVLQNKVRTNSSEPNRGKIITEFSATIQLDVWTAVWDGFRSGHAIRWWAEHEPTYADLKPDQYYLL